MIQVSDKNLLKPGNETAEQLFNRLLDICCSETNADSGWLKFMVSHENQCLKTKNINLKQISQVAAYLNDRLPQHQDDTALYLAECEVESFKSALIIPLKQGRQNLGYIFLLSVNTGGFERNNIEKVMLYVTQAILSFENKNLSIKAKHHADVKTEMKLAQEIQKSLIPKSLPVNGAYELSAFINPSKAVGGDFYDYFEMSDGRLALIIGDVSGKGIPASLYMAQIKGIFHTLFQFNLEPKDLMLKANNSINACFPRQVFATVALVIIDKNKKELEYIRAGHCPLLYYSATDNETNYLDDEGMGLGIVNSKLLNKHINVYKKPFNAGDALLLFTDGFVEDAEGGPDMLSYYTLKTGFEKVARKSAAEIKKGIYDDYKKRTSRSSGKDDLTMIAVKFK